MRGLSALPFPCSTGQILSFIVTCAGEGRDLGSFSCFFFFFGLTNGRSRLRSRAIDGGERKKTLHHHLFFSSTSHLLTVSLSVTEDLATRPPLDRRRSVGAIGARRREDEGEKESEGGGGRRRVVFSPSLSLLVAVGRKMKNRESQRHSFHFFFLFLLLPLLLPFHRRKERREKAIAPLPSE